MLKVAIIAICLAGCQLECTSQPQAPQARDFEIYKMIGADYVCTAWSTIDRPTIAITAGHCCDGHPGDTVQLTTPGGLSTAAAPIVWEDSFGPEADICLLRIRSPNGLGLGLPLAAEMPQALTPDQYVGYPRGKFESQPGLYLGVRDGAAYSTAVARHGASGAPLFTAAGVYAIVDQISPGIGDDGTGSDSTGSTGTTVTEIRRVLALVP